MTEWFGMKAQIDKDGICHLENGDAYDLTQPLNEWIKCSDRLPAIGDVVLLYQNWPKGTMFNLRAKALKDTFFIIGGLKYDKTFVSYENQHEDLPLKYIDYWMPLPPGPQ